MPIRLPTANWTQTRPVHRSTKAFDLSCAAIGAAAIGLAVFIDWFCYDRAGAVLVLLMAGGLIAALLRGARQEPKRSADSFCRLRTPVSSPPDAVRRSVVPAIRLAR